MLLYILSSESSPASVEDYGSSIELVGAIEDFTMNQLIESSTSVHNLVSKLRELL